MFKRIEPTHEPITGDYWQAAHVGRHGLLYRVTAVDDTHATLKVVRLGWGARNNSFNWKTVPAHLRPRTELGTIRRVKLDKFRPIRHGFTYVTRTTVEIFDDNLRDRACWRANCNIPGNTDRPRSGDAMAATFSRVPAGETFRL
jgi:hypothetical protein